MSAPSSRCRCNPDTERGFLTLAADIRGNIIPHHAALHISGRDEPPVTRRRPQLTDSTASKQIGYAEKTDERLYDAADVGGQDADLQRSDARLQRAIAAR